MEAALVAGGLREKTKKIQSALSKLENDFGTVTSP